MAWKKTDASGMADVSMSPDSQTIWLVGKNGTLWFSDRWNSFTRVPAPVLVEGKIPGFIRVASGGDGVTWMVASDGSLWHAHQGDFTKTDASGMADVAVSADDNSVWLAGSNGTVWVTKDRGKTFNQIQAEGFRGVSVGKGGIVWAVGSNGTLWSLDRGSWRQTPASGMQDVGSSPFSTRTYLAGANGTVWLTEDGGTFSQIEASGFHSIATQDTGDVTGRQAWAVGTNGTLWEYSEPILH